MNYYAYHYPGLDWFTYRPGIIRHIFHMKYDKTFRAPYMFFGIGIVEQLEEPNHPTVSKL